MGVDASPGQIVGTLIILFLFWAMLPSLVVVLDTLLSQTSGVTSQLGLVVMVLMLAALLNGIIKDLLGE